MSQLMQIADAVGKLTTRFDSFKARYDAQVAHVATINAFENKFGTWTGAIRNEKTREITRERFNSFDEARNWVRTRAYELFGEVSFAPMNRKGEYLANVWKKV